MNRKKLRHRKARAERQERVLGHDTDNLPGAPQHFAVELAPVLVEDADGSALGGDQSEDRAQQARFARAALAEKPRVL